jgi:hypothetical protein
MFKTLVVFLILACAVAQDLPLGSTYLGKGIDITVANLKPTTVDEVEATFGLPNIFKANVADDIDVTPLTSGQYSISAKQISTVSEVTSTYASTVSVSGSYGVRITISFETNDLQMVIPLMSVESLLTVIAVLWICK